MRALDSLARVLGIHFFHVDGFPFGRETRLVERGVDGECERA
jgi:hypothetical protein